MQLKIIASVLACAVAASQSCWAQVAIPPGLEPGQIQQQLRQLRMPAATSAPSAPRAPEQLAPPETDSLRFVLRDVQIEGVTVYANAELPKAFAPLIGKEISVAQVFDVANQLTARYRGDGYILSQVLVPAQNIVDGHVKLIAVEGYVAAVDYRGDVAQNAVLDSYSLALRNARPLTASVLERYLLLMNDFSQTTARGTLVPATSAAGAADLVVDFKREKARAAFDGNNRNSRSLGPWRASSDLEWDGAISSWDAVTLRAGWSPHDELSYANLGYGAPLGTRGARWSVGATGVRSRPGIAANLAATDLKTESVSGLVQVSYPLLRSRSLNLQVRGALTSFDGQSEFSLGDVSDDRLRALRAGLSLDITDRWRGITILDAEYSQGLNGLGAREAGTAESPLSRLSGRPDFSKLTLYAARLQSLGGRWSALLAVSAQRAFTTLLAPELFAFGGELMGRGYDAAELAGDSGESAKVELRYFATLSQWGALTPYAFFDAGRVQRRDPINESEHERASSLGAGLRWTGPDGRWNGFVELADPRNHVVAAEGNRDARVFAGLQVSF
ncbi:MAG: ShlB/FhaC/HecB family hemolysin secretion/activation protein [Gammaproteobacteria bacterium]